MNSKKIQVLNFLKFMLVILTLLNMGSISVSFSQSGNCDPSTPFFDVNLTGFPNGSWTSPAVPRVGNCCGTSSPLKCIEFNITLDPAAVAINFQIVSGAIPSGALFYQIGCGPPVAVGSPICLNGPGPYTLTFCKPGNNINTYAITSIAGPTTSPDDTIGNGCNTTMFASGLLVNSTINWTSIYPGPTGTYNSYLSCTTNCDSNVVTGTATAPPFVDYVVCGMPVAGGCFTPGLFCDTIRIHFSPPILNPVNPNPAIFCANTSGILLTGTVGGGQPPYTYAWTNGANGTGTVVGTGLTYFATTIGTFSFIVYDQNYPECPAQITNVPVTISPVPVINAGPDQTVCGSSFVLNGTVTGATGGIWSGGNGVYSPNSTSGNATYFPTVSEINSGIIILTFTSTGNGGCTPVSDQVVIHISPPLNVTIAAPALLCYGGTALLTANVNGGIPPYSYLWNTGQTTQSLTNMLPGTYSVTVTGSGGCSSTASLIITENPQIIVTTSPNNSISCNTTAAILAAATGGTGTLNYLWNNGAVTTSTIVYTGTYLITVTDAVGCSANNSVSVIATNSTLMAVVNQPSVLCNGATSTLTVSPSGGFGSYVYSWNTGATTASIVAGAGSYCATVTDGGGCTTSSCATVTQNPTLILNVPIPSIICNGASAIVTAVVSGGQAPYNYLWSNGQATQSITAIAGNYTVAVTDAIGCSVSTSVTITQAASLNVAMTSTPVGCFGGNNGSATANIAGGTPGYFYSWSPYGGSSATASNLLAGNFTLTVTDAIGCSVSSPILVLQPTPLNASVTINNPVSCFNGNNGSATVIPGGGTAGYSYSWNPVGGNGQSATNLPSGNYLITVTDANGCGQTVSTNLPQPSQLTGSIVSTTNVSCNGGNNGSATVVASGGTSGYTFLWTPGGGTNATASNLLQGTYTVTITDSKGCIVQATANITEPTILSSAITGNTNVSCYGGNNGTATVTPNGGTGSYSYSWNTIPVQTGATASNLTSGNYFVTVTDSKGCVTISPIATLTSPPNLTVIASPSALISCSSTITISSLASGGSGTYSYQWSNGSSTPSITVNTGTYTIVVTDGNGCTANNSVSVTASNSTLVASIPTPANICFGSTTSITANASGGFGSYSYQWNTGATTSSTVAGAGNHCVIVTDGSGCITNDCVNIPQNSPVVVSIGTPQTICPGASTTITASGSGGQPPYSFLWNTGQTSQSILKPAGTYTVTMTDATGSLCSATATVAINQETPISLSVSTFNVSCFDGNNGTATVYPTGGITGYTYSWAPSGGNNASATNLIQGTYTVTVTDLIGCIQTASATITQPLYPVSIGMSSTPVHCFGNADGTATVAGNGGSSPYFYYWWINGSDSATITGLTAGTYSATVADNTGCYTNATVTVSTPNDLLLTALSNPASCGNNNGNANVTATGGSGLFSYSWTPSGGNAATATNLSAGNYSVTVTDVNGCQKQFPLNVPAIPFLLTTNFNATTGCLNTLTSFTDMSISSNDAIVGWSWDFGDPSSGLSNFSSVQNPTHTYTSPGTFSVTLTVSTTFGCTGTYMTNVVVNPLPMASYAASPTCVNSPVLFTSNSLNGVVINGWSWDFGDPASGLTNISNLQNPTHVFATSGNYLIILTVTSDNGCSNTTTQNQFISGAPVAGFSAINVCQNLSTTFTDSSSISGGIINSWTWDFGDGSMLNYNQNPSYLYGNDGVYNVILTVTSTNGCQNSDTIPVDVYPLPLVSFSAPNVCVNSATIFNDLTTISSGTITSWAWNFGNFTPVYYGQNPNYMYSSPGIFNVSLTVTSSNACVGSVTQPVYVFTKPVANFTSNIACLNEPTLFTDISTGGPINLWLWGFGDGSPVSTIQNPSHAFINPGPYNVSLVVTNINSCIDTVTKPIMVLPLPIVLFSVADSNGCATYCTQFSDASIAQNGTFTSWIWDFGDHSFQSTLQNPQHCYPQSGIYTITLTATTSNGCFSSDSIVDLIQVFPVPEAEFTFSPQTAGTLNSEITFTDQSVDASEWMWNFGDFHDSTLSFLENPIHNYSEGGNYCIRLVVQNVYHCVDTAIHCLEINPEFSFFIPNAFTPGVSFGTNDGFGGFGTNISQYDMWIFDRWGNMIFHSNDLSIKWNGHANHGKDIAQQDVYVYLVELIDFQGNPHKFRGTVTLIR